MTKINHKAPLALIDKSLNESIGELEAAYDLVPDDLDDARGLQALLNVAIEAMNQARGLIE